MSLNNTKIGLNDTGVPTGDSGQAFLLPFRHHFPIDRDFDRCHHTARATHEFPPDLYKFPTSFRSKEFHSISIS